jgi:hypothetical protein
MAVGRRFLSSRPYFHSVRQQCRTDHGDLRCELTGQCGTQWARSAGPRDNVDVQDAFTATSSRVPREGGTARGRQTSGCQNGGIL